MKRMTRQREAILASLAQSKDPLSIEELLSLASAKIPQLNMATVYRNIKILLEQGEVTLIEVPGSTPRYETANRGHHHHFHCIKCDKIYDVEGCPGEMKALVPKDFQLIDHSLFLTGYCPPCQIPQTHS